MECNNSGASHSLWMDVELPAFPALDKASEADVCIVGSGIVGLMCAYTLAKKGKSVVVLDQGAIAGGQTARTTAHLTWVLDDRYDHLAQLFGAEGARIIAESHSNAIDYIENIVREQKIDCDFERVDGYLFVPPEDSKEILDQEFEAIQKTGKQVIKVDRLPFSSYDTGRGLRFPQQAQFHILKFLQGLIKAIVTYGGKIFSQTHVADVEDGEPCLVKTQSGLIVRSQAVIVATCTPVNDRFFIHTKQAAFRTYVIAAAIPQGSIPKGLYWDTADPYHYIRKQKHLSEASFEWLIVGGEDHRTGQDREIRAKYDHIEKWARARFPMMGKVEYRWSGQILEPIDSIAFIGRNPWDKHVYVATGDSGNGLTHGAVAGMLIPDLILGIDNPWEKIYDPARKTLAAAPKFLGASLNVAVQYMDWLNPGDREKIDRLAPKEGFVKREGLKKIAIYKDSQGTPHCYSALCPHLGGCVRWNSEEKSWECPCHGSRFDAYGKVITGPAISDLRLLDYA